MPDLNTLIRRYEFEDEQLLKEIVRRSNSEGLARKIVDIFKDESDLDIMTGLNELVCDIFCCRHRWVSRRYSHNFRQHLNQSDFRKILEQRIITKHNRLNITLCSFFKYADGTYIPILKKALKHALKYEPFEIPMIVSEINWLSHDFDWDIISRLCKSKDFLHRWAVLGIFQHHIFHGDYSIKKLISFTNSLINDPNPFVAQEARVILAKAKFERNYQRNMPKSKSAQKNYARRISPFQIDWHKINWGYAFDFIHLINSNLKSHLGEMEPSRKMYDALISFAWDNHPRDNKDYYKNLAVRIKEYCKDAGQKICPE